MGWKTKKVQVIEDILCNKCGESCKSDVFGTGGFYGLQEATVSADYFSPALEDCTHYVFSLCEHCLVKLFKDFTIPVEEQPYGREY